MTVLFPNDFYKFTVGLDDMFKTLLDYSRPHRNFPPYNLTELGDNKYAINVALAGYKLGDIEISVEKNILTVKTVQDMNKETGEKYLFQGIAKRQFSMPFVLAEHVEVTSAEMSDGILTVELKRHIPDSELPKKIKINNKPVLLQE